MTLGKLLAIALLPILCQAASGAAAAWVKRSNENAKLLLDISSRFDPEGASSLGLEGADSGIVDLKPERYERLSAARHSAIEELTRRMNSEKDPLVRQDLEILLRSAKTDQHASDVSHRLLLPYFDVNSMVFAGIHALLDDQVAPVRRRKALIRLRRYAGVEQGFTPLTMLAEQRTRERLSDPNLLGPPKAEVEKNLSNAAFYIDGIGQLFEKYHIAGYQQPYAKLKEELAAYRDFVRQEILPRSRQDFRLPPDLYAVQFEEYGLDIKPADLSAIAHAAFKQIQEQMKPLAAAVAKEKGYPSADYRDVIRQLKKEQFTGAAILPYYQKRLAEIEDIIRKEHLVTLPDRPARIRLATPAESASTPVPNMHPPRLLNNHGEKGEFVLPLSAPSNDGKLEKFDDFTYAAASWTLTAHEARPGHELQFDSMVERGVSTARAVYAFNSTNVEGWGLYSEAIMLPYMPPEGQLVSLDYRLLRAARAFLDPDLHAGKITPEQAYRVLTQDVVLSNAFANSEVERYTFRTPGQACSYFYGFTKLMALRQEVEKAQGGNFNAQRFHDFILAQGLLPPDLLREAVLTGFLHAN